MCHIFGLVILLNSHKSLVIQYKCKRLSGHISPHCNNTIDSCGSWISKQSLLITGMKENTIYSMENFQVMMKGAEIFERYVSSSESLNTLEKGIWSFYSYIDFFKKLQTVLIIRLTTVHTFHIVLHYLTENVFCLFFLYIIKVKESRTFQKTYERLLSCWKAASPTYSAKCVHRHN